jgi:exosortase
LAHGRLVPLLFVILLFESRRDPAPRFLTARASRGWIVAAIAVAGLALLTLGGLYAAVLDWSHALVEALLTAGTASLLAAGWIGLADARVRGLPFNWAAGASIGLWVLAAPIPPGTYSRLAGFLQQGVSAGVLATLQALGIAAYREGNVIELAHASVGISEACSGVRGLIACLATALFLSGAVLRRPRDRALVIALAPVFALAMNFVRSLLLTLLTNAGIDIDHGWHDATGYSIIGLTSGVLVALVWRLEARPTKRLAKPLRSEPPAPRPPVAGRSTGALPMKARAPGSQGILTAALLGSGLLGAFFVTNTHPFVPTRAATPDLNTLLPPAPAGWQSRNAPMIAAVAGILQTDVLAARSYLRPTADGGDQITLYVAYWRPGQAPVSLVSSHTPDACWPGNGWTVAPLSPPRQRLVVDGRALAPAECRLFKNGPYPQYVWYWHLYGGQPIQEEDPYTLAHLLHLAVRYGYKHDGDQLFVRVSSNHAWSEIAPSPTLVRFFEALKPLGL